jgi:23S rRNA (adenine2503-C2)-methyltransferase
VDAAAPLERGRRITFEYILIARFNDAVADARAVAALLRGIPCKVNVIPFNPDPLLPADQHPPSAAVTDDFVATLRSCDLTATVRRSRGQDVCGACGQLRSGVAVSESPPQADAAV